MKVHLVGKKTIESYVRANSRSRSSFGDWLGKLKYADWIKPADIKLTFGSADLLGKSSGRVVFSIGGNNYRIICKYAFGDKQVHLFICWIGTHAEYDELCDNDEQYIVRVFRVIIMAALKYTVIRNKTQYKEYSKTLEDLVFSAAKDKNTKEEIALLTLLIEKWDSEHNTFEEVDPVQLLHSLMQEHNMKAKDLVELLEISKGYVSDILNYKKGLSKEVIRKLAGHFKVSQEAFNRPYKLVVPENYHLRNGNVMNTKKKSTTA